LSCISARKPRTTFAVAFPIAPSESRGLKVTGFTASVDGEKLNRFGVNRWNLVDEDGEERSYYGYTWPTTIGRKADQVVTVEYTVLLPVRDNASSFTYVLRSGAAWHGLIGQETIRVTAEPGIHIRPGDSGSLRPAEQADRKIVWEIKDTDPADDVRVAILLEPVEGVARAPE
jgi:hypothetical protein